MITRVYVGYPKVATFIIEKNEKEQAKKVLEEAAEFYAAVQDYVKNETSENKKRFREEAADLNQALMNCLSMLGVGSVGLEEDAMDCFARNYARGRYEEKEPEKKPEKKPGTVSEAVSNSILGGFRL